MGLGVQRPSGLTAPLPDTPLRPSTTATNGLASTAPASLTGPGTLCCCGKGSLPGHWLGTCPSSCS